MKKILIPIPSYGFDPTETAIPWKTLSENRFSLYFSTPDGRKAAADRLMLTGEKLGPWRRLLMARLDAIAAYSEMEKGEAFNNPLSYSAIRANDFDAILLPGGHDPGIKEYLESEILQRVVTGFFEARKPVGAICHGVVLAARSRDSAGLSVLYNYKTTALLASQEMMAYRLTAWKLGNYYRTYPGRTVEAEVKAALGNANNFLRGPLPAFRDDYNHLKRGFIVRDRNYLSARWPGDVYNFSIEFMNMLEGK